MVGEWSKHFNWILDWINVQMSFRSKFFTWLSLLQMENENEEFVITQRHEKTVKRKPNERQRVRQKRNYLKKKKKELKQKQRHKYQNEWNSNDSCPYSDKLSVEWMASWNKMLEWERKRARDTCVRGNRFSLHIAHSYYTSSILSALRAHSMLICSMLTPFKRWRKKIK